MKLRTKIQLIFGGTAILLMSLMGSVAYSLSYQTQMQMVQTDVNRASALASENLSNQLQNYMNVTSIAGTDSIIRDSSASISVKGIMQKDTTKETANANARLKNENMIYSFRIH